MHHELEIVDDDVSDVMDVTRVRHHVDDFLNRHRSVESKEGHRKSLEGIGELIEPIQTLGQIHPRILSNVNERKVLIGFQFRMLNWIVPG